MDAEDLELAAEFCKLVAAPNLVAYLGLQDEGPVTPELGADAVARLKARRKFMQGMQGNPKYKREALFLIKHFSNLNGVLQDVEAYLEDARRREESEHLPVVEMTVRGVLAGGGVTEDQVDYLRRNAAELGVSEETFVGLLSRVATELDVRLSPDLLDDPTQEAGGQLWAGPIDGSLVGGPHAPLDLYQLLGIAPSSNEDDVRIAYHQRVDALDEIADPDARETMRRRIEIARKVLTNEAARRHYDLTSARTGPPARARELIPGPPRRPQAAPTAPPVRERWADPTGPGPRLEILGDPIRMVWLSSGIAVTTIVIRNGGQGAMPGGVKADVPWVVVDPARLDPAAEAQQISVQIDPSEVPEGATTAVVSIETERGERARVVLELKRSVAPSLAVAIAASVFVVGLLMVALVSWWS
jgi:hypothetical protein